MWSNADEVEDFIEGHKGGRWEVGQSLTLPDIEQRYTIVAVRPFTHRGRFQLYVDLEAQCAVEGCPEYLLATKEVHQWKTNKNLPRCCAGHRYQFTTDMPNAWKTAAQRAAIVPKQPKAKRKPKQRVLGSNELALRRAIEVCRMIEERPQLEHVLKIAVSMLDRPKGDRDTRRQVVQRCVSRMAERGELRVSGGRCVLGGAGGR